jgi:hypothetical protein
LSTGDRLLTLTFASYGMDDGIIMQATPAVGSVHTSQILVLPPSRCIGPTRSPRLLF